MTDRIVFAYFGDEESAASIARARAAWREVIAVAFDIGACRSLNQLRLSALAAGATKCHALDVREDFLREVVMPALQVGGDAAESIAVSMRATSFANERLQIVAAIEQADMIARHDPVPIETANRVAAAAGSASLQITFTQGIPVAVNDVPMTLAELMESVQTISNASPLHVMRRAYAELELAGEGDVILHIEHGDTVAAATTV